NGSELNPHLLARLLGPAQELVRQGKSPEEVQRELIAKGATAAEAANIAGIAQTTEVVLQFNRRPGKSPDWLEYGREWLNLVGFLFILGGASVLVLGTIGAVRGVREISASVLLLGGAAAALGFGVCLMLRHQWARWVTFLLCLLMFVILVGHTFQVVAADPW